MGTAERRTQIMLILCRRRHDTVLNLAKELGVSTRTILRDIEVLSITEPIYTQCGRYGGGIYVTAEYTMTRMYMTEKELAVLHKLSKLADEKSKLAIKHAAELEQQRKLLNEAKEWAIKKREEELFAEFEEQIEDMKIL